MKTWNHIASVWSLLLSLENRTHSTSNTPNYSLVSQFSAFLSYSRVAEPLFYWIDDHQLCQSSFTVVCRSWCQSLKRQQNLCHSLHLAWPSQRWHNGISNLNREVWNIIRCMILQLLLLFWANKAGVLDSQVWTCIRWLKHSNNYIICTHMSSAHGITVNPCVVMNRF